jgi:hypothetical protein
VFLTVVEFFIRCFLFSRGGGWIYRAVCSRIPWPKKDGSFVSSTPVLLEKYTGWTVALNSTYNFSKSAMDKSIDLTHLGDRGAGKKEK